MTVTRPIAPPPTKVAPGEPGSAPAIAEARIHPDLYIPETPEIEKIIAALRSVYDPEIPVNIYDLGLIYNITPAGEGTYKIDMSLTAPGCPVAGEMPGMVSSAAETVAGVKEVAVTLVWEPAWDKARMSEDAKLALGFF